jgi:hypothetical protein
VNIPSNIAKRLKPGETLCFLSHFKTDAASAAIYFHGVLCSRFHCSSSQVFLDSNELNDLRHLVDLVKKTKVLVGCVADFDVVWFVCL